MRSAAVLLLLVAFVGRAEEPKLIIKPEAFETLVNPNCSHCVDEAKRRKDDLKDGDRVLAWTRGKYDGGAIPFRFFLNPYRVISDTYGTFVYDPDAGYARAFKASLDFRFHGWRNGVMVMKHKDGTLYSCLTGFAFDGPRMGEHLTPWPTIVTDWGWTMKHYPDGVAYHMYEKYKPTELPTKLSEDSVKSRAAVDKRLPADEMVLGVAAPNGRARPRAYRLADLDAIGRFAAVQDVFECGNQAVIFWDRDTKTATAYRPIAEKRAKTEKLSEEGELQESKTDLDIVAGGKSALAPFLDKKTGSRFDLAGRCIEGELKGWTLAPLDSVMVKWFAWSAESPVTTVYAVKVPAPAAPPAPEPKAETPAKPTPTEAIKEITGTAEFLKSVPKHFATFKNYDAIAHTVTLLIDGEKVPKAWPLLPDAEVKVSGWWGRPEQFKSGDRVWVWLAADRQKMPRAVMMMCDEASELEIHGKPGAKDFAEKRSEQAKMLALLWSWEGLPGTVTFAHVAGEVEVMLDHEAMKWARSLKLGDAVGIEDPTIRKQIYRLGTPVTERSSFIHIPNSTAWHGEPPNRDENLPVAVPIKALVKDVKPWRERTRVTLVVNGVDIAAFEAGKRTVLKIKMPAKEILESDYPSDIGLKRTKDERVEWFLASMYCTCKIGGDNCTGDFYTLASCNPNGCGAPNATRKRIAAMIDKSMDDKQIFDDLRVERGALMTKPHLLQ